MKSFETLVIEDITRRKNIELETYILTFLSETKLDIRDLELCQKTEVKDSQITLVSWLRVRPNAGVWE